MGFGELETWALLHCPGYAVSWATPWLVLTRYTTLAITLALYGVGLRYRELYLLLLGFGVTANGLVNWLLKLAFAQPVPVGTCGTDVLQCVARPDDASVPPGTLVACGMPSFEVQDTTFLVAALLLYAFHWRHPAMRSTHFALAVVWVAIVAYAHAFFAFNSAGQIVGAGVAGVGMAALWHAFVALFLYPRFDATLRWSVVQWMGYRDSLCRCAEPVPGDPAPMIYS